MKIMYTKPTVIEVFNTIVFVAGAITIALQSPELMIGVGLMIAGRNMTLGTVSIKSEDMPK